MVCDESCLNSGDYCLYCKDYCLDFPSNFERCVILIKDEIEENCYEVKLLDSNKVVHVNEKELILIKKKPVLEIELMYNSKSEIGGSYNVTSGNGTHLKASFYFDNNQEQQMAKKYAERYIRNFNLI